MADSSALSRIAASPLTAEWSILVWACTQEADTEQTEPLLARNPDWRLLLHLAKEHGVTTQLAQKLGAQPGTMPPEIQQELQRTRREQALSALAMVAELFRLMDGFRGAAIEALAIKGPVLSMRAYGDSGARPYGDLDFLIRGKDIERATEFLVEAGYEPRVPLRAIRERRIPGEYLFRKIPGQLLVELHTEQSLRYFPRRMPIDVYFARQSIVEIDGHAVPALAPEHELVHICVHGSKHLWERLLWVADVAAVLRKSHAMDWTLVAEAAEEVGATRMLHVGLYLASEMLKAPLPNKLNERIRKDAAAARIALRVRKWLPFAGHHPPSLLERAAYRAAIRGGGVAGAKYLWRISTSPTEKDWQKDSRSGRFSGTNVVRRLLRLAREYGRGEK